MLRMDVLGGCRGAFPCRTRASFVRADSLGGNNLNLQDNRWRVKNVGVFRHDSRLRNHGWLVKRKSGLEAKWINACNSSGTLKLRCGRQPATQDAEVDVVLLSNGPGEVATWVKPVLDSIRRQSGFTNSCIRISVVLQPCPHASGKEVELVESYNQVNRCLGPQSFWNLVLFGLTEGGWAWSRRGVCVFLGGDQLYTLLLSQRLGYKSIMYSEDSVRWPGLVDMYMLRSAQTLTAVPSWAHSKCKVVGDLFSDAVSGMQPQTTEWCNFKTADSTEASIPVVGFLPGSKPSKLALGVPYFLAVADHLHRLMMGRVRFLLPLAPTATLDMLEKYADKSGNPHISRLNWASGKVSLNDQRHSKVDHKNEKTSDGMRCRLNTVGQLVTDEGIHIDIVQHFPAYDVFKRCSLCITTIGTNTAELGYLGIPMLVVLPTHALEVFKGGTGGLLGLLANIPGTLGNSVARSVNSALLRSSGYIAWPNRWVGREVVPELVGRIEPVEVANIGVYYLENEERLKEMRDQLLRIHSRREDHLHSEVDSKNGAAEAIATEIFRLLTS